MTNHLDYVQNTLNRMSNNSFLIKGWTIALISLLFILTVKESNQWLLLLSLFPLLLFWGLDAYYLRQERLFRKLYDAVRLEKLREPFSMDTKPFDRFVKSWFLTLFSSTIAPIYITIIFLNLFLQLLIVGGFI